MKVDRLISIIMILLDKERIGAQALADILEVSPRTVYRDIDTIGMAGIPVRATPGVGGGFEIMPKYKVDNKFFSPDDLSAILMGLSNLSETVRGNEVAGVLAKVKSFIPADRAKEIALKANQISIDLTPWLGNETTQPFLEMIKTALRQSKLVSFAYIDRYGQQTVRTAEPYQLILKSSHWYFQGFCHARNDFRLFRLSRMVDLQIQEQTFIPREYRKPQPAFNDILESLQTEIKIRIHKCVLDRALEYCAYENFLPDGDEHYIVDFPFIENEYHYGILLGFGNKCECLEPSRVRAEMKRRVQDIAALYER